MNCCSQNVPLSGGFIPCDQLGTLLLWCPSWSSADKGPQVYCEKHARTYQPERNPYVTGGLFFWGDDAKSAYAECGEIIRRSDGQYTNARKMCESGTPLDWHGPKSLGSPSGWWCVDGQVWLITAVCVTCVGDFQMAKARYAR